MTALTLTPIVCLLFFNKHTSYTNVSGVKSGK